MTRSGHPRSLNVPRLNGYGVVSLAAREGEAMRRREFITLIVGAGATWPMTTSAQQTGKLPIVGFLGASASGFAPWAAAFVARMRELGWVELLRRADYVIE